MAGNCGGLRTIDERKMALSVDNYSPGCSRLTNPAYMGALATLSGNRAMNDDADATFFTCRKLLRAARCGTLATSMQGQPFASLVTPACAPDLAVVMLLSSLSEHTRHLRDDPRCSLMVWGAPETVNPQTTPRVTITGVAEVVADPSLRARYLAVHPYAALYADFGDFAFWRVRPLTALYVGGFGRAGRVRGTMLAPDATAVEAVAGSEADIISHCNADHPDALTEIAGEPGDWQMVAADVDGCDLALGERIIRVHWSAPVADVDGVRAELVQMVRALRAG
jgi:heme iron utilization protein